MSNSPSQAAWALIPAPLRAKGREFPCFHETPTFEGELRMRQALIDPPGPWIKHDTCSAATYSRIIVQTISATILDNPSGVIRCPKVLQAALDFGGRDPVSYAYRILHSQGLKSPEQLRAAHTLPNEGYICRADPDLEPALVTELPEEGLLFQLLLLGLCTATAYLPARPVLWTTASLTRRIQLFQWEGFYA